MNTCKYWAAVLIAILLTQRPPLFSALSVQGTRAYRIAIAASKVSAEPASPSG